MRMAGFIAEYPKYLLLLAIVVPLLALLVLSSPVHAAPVVALTPSSGAVGTTMMISGTNFDSYKGDKVSIYFDDIEIPNSPLTVPDTGIFTIQYIVPGDAEIGRHWVTVTPDGDPDNVLGKNFFVVEEAEIHLDVADGHVGTQVTISGYGFYADRTVTFYYYNIVGEKLGTAVASSIGELEYSFIVPGSIAGIHKITAINNEGNSAETQFIVIPHTALNLSSGSPGEVLSITGTGFGHKCEAIIDFGTRPVASARTDEFGYFEVKFNIPSVYPGMYDVKSLDEYDNLDKVQFVATAGATLDISEGAIGTRLTVTGTGFTVREDVNVTYDELLVAVATADNNGAFIASFDVPPSSAGEHIITATDGTITKKFTFTVESEAPITPVLSLPSDNNQTRAGAYLDWHDVSDVSQPVVYHLQIASDRNFSSIAMEKLGLMQSEYTLPEDNGLPTVGPEVAYYWRVKATDSAGNESEWSSTWSFFVSAPPVPELLQPESDSQANTPVYFNWQDVTSLSPPIAYHLQIATDLNFSDIALEKTGLADSEYYLTREDELPDLGQDVPYYWRVKAVDNAGNESNWSPPWSIFLSSSFNFPEWLTYLLIAIGVIIVGYLAYWVGKRTATKPPE